MDYFAYSDALAQPGPVDAGPGKPRRIGAVVVVVVLIAASAMVGGAVGATVRQGAVDSQHRRALKGERSIQQLKSSNDDQAATIASQETRIASFGAESAAQARVTKACRDAVASAEKLASLSDETASILAEGFAAARSPNTTTLGDVAARLNAVTDQLTEVEPTFAAQKAACEG
jgi:hypothetical protein